MNTQNRKPQDKLQITALRVYFAHVQSPVHTDDRRITVIHGIHSLSVDHRIKRN